MISSETEAKIVKLFICLFEGEKAVEITRRALAQFKDFDVYQIFQGLDIERKNYIDEYNISEFLRLKNIYATAPEARLIISFYDSDYDGNLNYTEFLNMILSDYDLSIRRKIRESFGYKNGFPLGYDVEYCLAKILEKELELARSIESIIGEIKNRFDFKMLEIYSLVQGGASCICESSLMKFFIRNSVNFEDYELKNAFKRIDIDKDSRVTFTEFKKLFTAATGGSFCSNQTNFNNKSDIFNNYFKNGKNENLENYSNTSSPIKETFGYTWKQSGDFLPSSYRLKSPIKDKTIGILCKSSEKFNTTNFTKNQNTKRYDYNDSISKSPLHDEQFMTTNCKSTNFYSTNHTFDYNYFDLKNKRSQNKIFYQRNKSEDFCHYKDSFFDSEEENFINFIKELLDLENEIESAKRDLIVKADFNMIETFRIFELSERGILSQLDIKYGMNSLDIYPSEEEISLLVKRYDMSKEGILSYHDFFGMLAPLDREYRMILEKRIAKDKIPSRHKSDAFLSATRICLQDLLRVLINVECRVEFLRQRLNRIPNFEIKSLFNKIDKLEKGYISDIDLINYLRKNKINHTSKELDYIFLRFDFDRDSKIQYNEFNEEINPKSKEDFY